MVKALNAVVIDGAVMCARGLVEVAGVVVANLCHATKNDAGNGGRVTQQVWADEYTHTSHLLKCPAFSVSWCDGTRAAPDSPAETVPAKGPG
jgi:hypothetical protein